MCLKPNSLGVYCDGGYADYMTVPHPKYLLNLKGSIRDRGALCVLRRHHLQRLKKVEASFNSRSSLSAPAVSA